MTRFLDFFTRIKIGRDNLYTFLTLGVFLLIFSFVIFSGGSEIEVENKGLLQKFANASDSVSESRCVNPDSRPLAVMFSSDEVARPLSGIGQADIVFEMEVTDSGVTRMMGIFQCQKPNEIGSIRSSRLDFIPLVQGMGAIYSHWGGEREALEKLNRGIVDNVDAMKYDGTIYYRKKGIPMPHDGFTKYEDLISQAKKLGYDVDYFSLGYVFQSPSVDLNQKRTILGTPDPPSIYHDQFQASWEYDDESNTYLRFRGDKEEVDALLGQQISVSNVVVMETNWTPVNQDYIRVTTIGAGEATVYKDGQSIRGIWEKPTAESKLEFRTLDGKEIPFTSGKVWIEIDAGILPRG